MSRSTRQLLVFWGLVVCVAARPAPAQIVENGGDNVLNAAYRGTINSLREGTFDVGYGEVRSFVEPVGSATLDAGYPIRVWHDPVGANRGTAAFCDCSTGWTHPGRKST